MDKYKQKFFCCEKKKQEKKRCLRFQLIITWIFFLWIVTQQIDQFTRGLNKHEIEEFNFDLN